MRTLTTAFALLLAFATSALADVDVYRLTLARDNVAESTWQVEGADHQASSALGNYALDCSACEGEVSEADLGSVTTEGDLSFWLEAVEDSGDASAAAISATVATYRITVESTDGITWSLVHAKHRVTDGSANVALDDDTAEGVLSAALLGDGSPGTTAAWLDAREAAADLADTP